MKSKQAQNNKVGLYMRLSKDDERAGESLSIENQRIILTKYVSEHGWDIVDEYIDDGYSGTNFDRPNVQRLLEDAKTGRIDTIVVKDLSRFGRNYILVGQYVDYIFPSYDIRFIAISDNVDTANADSSGMDMMPIMNVFNEWHSANTSKKIRAAKEAIARTGKYGASFAPYGYLNGTDEKRTLVVDDYAASVVQRIFEMRAQGLGKRVIAVALTKEGIEPPSVYKARIYPTYKSVGTRKLWNCSQIDDILHNPAYIGDTAQMRKTTVSYKNKRSVRKSQEEWITVKGTHEPIISKELWGRVREMDQSVARGKRTSTEQTVKPLSGLLYCSECGAKMRLTYHYARKNGKNVGKNYSYNCGNFMDLSSACNSKSITEKVLNALVLEDIRAKAKLVLDDEEAMRAAYLKRQQTESDAQTKGDAKRLKAIQKRLTELDSLIKSCYEDKVLKRVPEDICIDLLNRYTQEKSKLTEQAATIGERLQNTEQARSDVDAFIAKVKQYVDIKELTREICLELINYITIGPIPQDKNAPREIHIYYKLIDKNHPPKHTHACP